MKDDRDSMYSNVAGLKTMILRYHCYKIFLDELNFFSSFVSPFSAFLRRGLSFQNRVPILAQACDYRRGRLWIRFPLEDMKYLIFSFPCSGNGAKRIPPPNKQCIQNSAESETRKDLNGI